MALDNLPPNGDAEHERAEQLRILAETEAAGQDTNPEPPRDPQLPPLRVVPRVNGQVPQHDTVAERACLGSVLQDEQLLEPLLEIVSHLDFYSAQNQIVLRAMVAVHAAGKSINLPNVNTWLRDHDLLPQAGGIQYLTELLDETPRGLRFLREFAATVADKARIRRIGEAAHRIANDQYDPGPEYADRSLEQLTRAAGQHQSSLIELCPASELFAAVPPVDWLVRDIDIAPGAPTLVCGYGYSGKTVSCQALALAVATHTPLWGLFRVLRKGAVIHLDYEQGKRLTLERYQRQMRALRVDERDIGDRLRVAIMPPLYLDDPRAEQQLERLCRGVTLCIIDSFRAACPSIDENSSEARRELDKLTRVSEHTGCCFLVIHHARKPQEGDGHDGRAIVRGSGAIFDACSSVLVMSRQKNEDAVAVQHEKARNLGKKHEPFLLDVQDVAGEHVHESGAAAQDARWGLEVTGSLVAAVRARRAQDDSLDLKARVLEHIRRNACSSQNAIAQVVNGRKETIAAAIRELAQDGKIRNLGESESRAKWVVVDEN